MATTKRLEFFYDQERDILSLAILPRRRSVMDHTAHGFHYCTSWDDPGEIVGFEIWDFAYFIPHLYEAGVIPEIQERFDVVGTELRNATLREVLEWAYQRLILEKRAGMMTHLYAEGAVQAVAEERGEYELSEQEP
ncbi:MAG: hypothetical protein ACE5LU_22765 [Anaerolineae bacterium]